MTKDAAMDVVVNVPMGSECKKCYGRGYIGFDPKAKSKDGQPVKVQCPKCFGTGDRTEKERRAVAVKLKIAQAKKVLEETKNDGSGS